MEEKRTIFDYLAHILLVFGFTMLMMNLFCFVFGDSAKEFSALFALGSQGVPIEITFQCLGISALIVGIRFIFFTDFLIKKMQVWLRTICMLAAVIAIIAIFIIAFHWFPTDMWQPWTMFFICFGICFAGSYLVMITKEKAENKKMEEALQQLKRK